LSAALSDRLLLLDRFDEVRKARRSVASIAREGTLLDQLEQGICRIRRANPPGA
jgi:hypothetical protein